MEAVIVSTTIASVMLLFASDNDPDTFKVPTLAVARVEVPLKLLNARPVIDEPVKLMLPFCTDKLVEVTLLIVPFVPAKLVKKPLVDVTEVPVAVVKPNAPDNVPPVSKR